MPEDKVEKLGIQPPPIITPKFANYGVQHPIVYFDKPVPQHQHQTTHQNMQQHSANVQQTMNFSYQPMPIPNAQQQMFFAPPGYYPPSFQQAPYAFYGLYPGYTNFHQQVPHQHQANSNTHVKQPIDAQPQINWKIDYSDKFANQSKYQHPNANKEGSRNDNHRQFDRSTGTNMNQQRYGGYNNKGGRFENQHGNVRNQHGNASNEFHYSNNGRGNYNNGFNNSYGKPRKVVSDANKIELPSNSKKVDRETSVVLPQKDDSKECVVPETQKKTSKNSKKSKKNRKKGGSKHVDKPEIPEVMPKCPSPKTADLDENDEVSESTKTDELVEKVEETSNLTNISESLEKNVDLQKADDLSDEIDFLILNENAEVPESTKNDELLENNVDLSSADDLSNVDDLPKVDDLSKEIDDLSKEIDALSKEIGDLPKAVDLLETNENVETSESTNIDDSPDETNTLDVQSPKLLDHDLAEVEPDVQAVDDLPEPKTSKKTKKKKAKKSKEEAKHSGEFEVLKNEAAE